MNYLKAFIAQVLIVFFANYFLPDVQVMSQTKLPHIGGDVIFALALGALNMLIYPMLKLTGHTAIFKIIIVAIVLNFVAYAVLKLLPLGIDVMGLKGYALVSIVVAIGSVLVNYFEMKKHSKKMPEMPQ